LIRRGILYFFIITLSLYFLRELHYKGLLKNNGGYYAKYRTAFLTQNKYNVLFLGSSRVEMHYNTGAFDSLTGKNSFNLGLPGATVHESFAALKGYLEKSVSPEYLIYELDFHGLREKTKGIMEFNNFFPFLSNKTFRDELQKIDPRTKWFHYIPYYSWPYTGLKNLSTSLHGWLNIPNNTDKYYYKGFYKEMLREELSYRPAVKKYVYFNVSERAYLDSLMGLCRERKIKLSFITSPLFAGGRLEVDNYREILGQLVNIAKINHIPYFNYSSVHFCKNRELFIDHYHMNFKGTVAFTPYLCAAFNNKISRNPLK
jgi:hypothetical protein